MDDQEGFESLKRSIESKRFRLRLEECRPTTELERLRGFFHASIVPEIAKAAGYAPTKEELKIVKDGLKERFLTVPAAPGEPAEVRSTESLTESEYSEFIGHCIQYAAETFSVAIRDPRKRHD